jgi:hypothetical protein
MTNNLYIINEVLSDYTSGMVVIAAPSLDRCREIFIEWSTHEWSGDYNNYYLNEYDRAIADKEYKVIEGVNHPEGMVSYVYGGG